MASTRFVPVLAVTAVAFLGSVVFGRQDAPMPTFRSGVNVLQFDVTVLDKSHHPVSGLTQDDFVVTDDGKPVPVVGVNWIEMPAPPPASAPWVKDVAPDVVTNGNDVRRIVVFVIDDAMTGNNPAVGRDPWILQTGREIARDVIAGLGPDDLAAVAYTYMGRTQEFTTDHAKLLKAIESYIPQDGAQLRTRSEPELGPPTPPSVVGVDSSYPLGCAYKGQDGCTLDTLVRVVDALPTTPPLRKLIVFISQGKGAIPGFTAEALSGAEAQVAARDVPPPDLRRIQNLYRRLQETNTTVYSFSPGGVMTSGPSDDATLQIFSESTGGRAFGGNRPWTGVPEMFAETNAYYLVGIEDTRDDGKFHKISVQVKQRPDLEVKTRAGYIADAPADAAKRETKPAATPIDQALSQDFPKSDLPMIASAAAFALPLTHNAVVQIVTGIPSDAEPPEPWSLSLASVAFDTNWKPRAEFRQTVEVSPAASRLAEAHARLTLAPGRYQVRTAGDGQNKTGSLLLDVDIPDFTKAPLSTSGLVLVGQPPPMIADTRLDVSKLAPTIQRTFAQTNHPHAVLEVYEGGGQPTIPVTIETSITDNTGRRVSATSRTLSAAQFASSAASLTRTAAVVYDLPLAQLATGDYLLTMAASTEANRAESHIRFRRN